MRSFIKLAFRFALLATATVILVFLLVAFWPKNRTMQFHSEPVRDYVTARETTRQLLANPPPEVRPECRSTVLDHGYRTRYAYVLLHGLTNCPAQFRVFADQLYASGANVLLLRLPYHGFTDRMTPEQSRFTAQDLLDSANTAVDLAQGYGEHVIVIGLSISGVSAAWLAQERSDVDLAVVIAPFLTPIGVPSSLTSPLSNLLLRLPNAFVWWDPRQKEALVGSPVSYPRFATRSIGEVMKLGLDLFARAGTAPPQAGKILIVTSPTDTAISAPRVDQLAGLWHGHVQSRMFPASWNVPHDCIDPSQPGEQTARVYPQLVEWMNEQLR